MSHPLNKDQLDLAESALNAIKFTGLNQFRCVLTGAPYATIYDDEIRMALKAEIASNPNISADRLVDAWNLRALVYCTNLCPSLLNSTDSMSLATISNSGPHGQARTITYFLTRFFFPASKFGGKVNASESMIERMEFSARLFDTIKEVRQTALNEGEQRLAAADAWCELNHWEEINLVKSPRSEHGIRAEHNAEILGWLKEPQTFIDSLGSGSLQELTDFMMDIMVEVSSRSEVETPKGSKMARNVFAVVTDSVPTLRYERKGMKPLTRKEIAGFEDAFNSMVNEVNQSAPMKFAWSATHGKGHIMGAALPDNQRKSLRKTKAKTRRQKKPLTDKQKVFKESVDLAFLSEFKLGE